MTNAAKKLIASAATGKSAPIAAVIMQPKVTRVVAAAVRVKSAINMWMKKIFVRIALGAPIAAHAS